MRLPHVTAAWDWRGLRGGADTPSGHWGWTGLCQAGSLTGSGAQSMGV